MQLVSIVPDSVAVVAHRTAGAQRQGKGSLCDDTEESCVRGS